MSEKMASTRILPRRPKKKGPAKQITRDQIMEALQAFHMQGGLIRQLPAEVGERHARVGHRWDTVYEMPMERY